MAVALIISSFVMRAWPPKTLPLLIGFKKFSRCTLQRVALHTRHNHVTLQTIQLSQIGSKFHLYAKPRMLSSTESFIDGASDNMAIPEDNDDRRKSKLGHKHKNVSGVNVLESVGRFIPHSILDITDASGNTHVGVTRNEAMKLSKQSNMKLVLVNPKSKPNPSYRLMSGAELHQERLKAKETQDKKRQTEVKEMTISDNISKHDLMIKTRQIQNWMERSEHQYHVRITVMHKKTAGAPTTVEDKMKLIHEILDGLNDVTINAPPSKFGKDGDGIRVTLRHMSAKEKIKHRKEKENQ
ncbi:translation initiation factor IF-3, mitochondrial-like [Anneissia japonica]|uniref:translation initiation factor IF-3, mitochondrial-like n=1 Tax=Anneissia japonica TaxID=1529436 RepID=UPI0014255F92|nr:translation initiation factor IF-3, mitochondrial-like [Anneissia japonica]